MNTCISYAVISDKLELTNTILSGTPPYNVTFRIDDTILNEQIKVNTTVQTFIYTITTSDEGLRHISVTTSDSCSVGAKTVTKYCDVTITTTSELCNQLIVEPQTSSFKITKWGFKVGNIENCNKVPNSAINENVQMWAEVQVDNASNPIKLKESITLKHTDFSGNIINIITENVSELSNGLTKVTLNPSTILKYAEGTYDVMNINIIQEI